MGKDGRVPRIRGASIEEHHEMVWADLAEAMRELLLERDYESITMGHIAAKAGLARNTLYNYAADKSALVLALTRRATSTATPQPRAMPTTSVRASSTSPLRCRGVMSAWSTSDSAA